MGYDGWRWEIAGDHGRHRRLWKIAYLRADPKEFVTDLISTSREQHDRDAHWPNPRRAVARTARVDDHSWHSAAEEPKGGQRHLPRVTKGGIKGRYEEGKGRGAKGRVWGSVTSPPREPQTRQIKSAVGRKVRATRDPRASCRVHPVALQSTLLSWPEV